MFNTKNSSRTERGATAVEYALMIGLIAVAIIGAVTFASGAKDDAKKNTAPARSNGPTIVVCPAVALKGADGVRAAADAVTSKGAILSVEVAGNTATIFFGGDAVIDANNYQTTMSGKVGEEVCSLRGGGGDTVTPTTTS